MIKVSIVVTSYNIEKEIEKCIFSIINQTYSNIEVLIVDDGSKDNTVSVIKKIIHNDSRCKLYEKKNGGPSSARNFGKDKVLGDYVTFIDGDDYIDPDYIERLVNSSNNCDLVICGFKYIFLDGQKKDITAIDFSVSIDEFIDKYYISYIEKQLIFGPINKLYKKEIIKDVYFPEEYFIREDGIFVMDYINKCKTISSTSRTCGYNYIQHKTNQSLISKINSNELMADEVFYRKMLNNIQLGNIQISTGLISRIYVGTITTYTLKYLAYVNWNYKKSILLLKEIKNSKEYNDAVRDSMKHNISNIKYCLPSNILYLLLKIKYYSNLTIKSYSE